MIGEKVCQERYPTDIELSSSAPRSREESNIRQRTFQSYFITMEGVRMDITVSGRHLTVTEPIKAYAIEKISKISRIHDSEELHVEVVVSHDRNPAIPNHDHVEITGRLRDFVIRVEEAAPDMYAAIDVAAEALERQMAKFKTRILARRRTKDTMYKGAPGDSELMLEPLGELVREKQLGEVEFTVDEAILQMELVGHDFFMFRLQGTEESAVVYKRAAGDYGMLRM